MKFTSMLSIVLGAALVPAVAHAQAPDQNPDDQNYPPPAAPQAAPPQAPPPAQVPPPQTTSSNQPVVVVNPGQPAPQPQVQPRPEPASPETEEESDFWNAPVFVTGAVVFAGTYGASVIVSNQSSHPGADRLDVPVVGPWLALSDWGSCPVDQPRCDQNTTDKVLLVADGVFQAAGLITMVDALIAPSTHSVVMQQPVADTKVHITPTGNGFALFGHF